jgi:hypothetical protein
MDDQWRCGTCIFYHPAKPLPDQALSRGIYLTGQCRAHPQTYPKRPDEGCGEWRSRPDAETPSDVERSM